MNQKEPEGRKKRKNQKERDQEEPEGRNQKKLEKLFSLKIKIKQANLEKEIPVGGVQVLVRAEIKNNKK
jgi:hypothetical protein